MSATAPPPLTAIAVYCGSSRGSAPAHAELATALGRELGSRRLTLVYGGGHVGLMGVVADAALAAGGRVHGVITRALMDRELGHAGIDRLDQTESMHERKAAMEHHASGFIALPGGFGTLDEIFEVITWAQLGIHAKPIGFLDADGFYEPLFRFVDQMVEQRFVRPAHRDMLLRGNDPVELLDALATWRPPTAPKWIDRDRVPEP